MEIQRVGKLSWMCLLIFLLGIKGTLAGISIAPAFVEVSLDKKRPAGQFIIKNTGTETERYRIMASHFIFTEDGRIARSDPDENSLVEWIKFNPKEFSMPPKSSRSIRYMIVPRGKIAPKEYWGFMELQSLTVNTASADDKAGRSMKLKIIPTILVPIFAKKGEIHYSAALGQLQLLPNEKGMEIDSKVKNTGNGHLLLKGHYEMIDNFGNVIKNGPLGKGYVFPGHLKRFKGIMDTDDIPKGSYTLNVIYSAPTLKEIITGNIPYSH